MVSMDHKREANYRGPDLKLFIRDVRDHQGKKRPITVRSWATVKDVKGTIQQLTHIPVSAQRLYFGPLLTSGKELPNHRTLHDAGIYRSGETILLDIKGATPDSDSSKFSSSSSNDLCVSSSMYDATPKPLRNLVQQARRGFAVGLKPDLALEGSGGTYFLHDCRKNKIAVFKPADEEPYANNNPRGYLPQREGDSLREGIVPGEACIREVAAFLLDHGGFSGVPMTTLVEARHPAFNTNGSRLNVSQGGASIGSHSFIPPNSPAKPNLVSTTKPGSFQEFVRCECTIDDISPSKISVEEIHKIAILDIRIMNADRNAANLLIRRKVDNTLELIPIDHGYCLRSVCDVSWMDWCWLDWPQLKEPLSEEHKKYIEKLDIEADAQMLRERLNICEEAVDYFRASSALLKAGVAAGLTLYDIAVMCCRNDNLAELPSMMEKLFDMASELAHVAVENERWHHTAASRALVEQLCPSGRRRSSMIGTSEHHQCKNLQQRFMRKSSSSAEFITIINRAEVQSYRRGEDSPGLVQSSASDTSSDIGDDYAAEEKEDCEEWAAKVIADVSVDQIIPVTRVSRSASIESDDASSDSGGLKGFWYVRPGTANGPSSDDGSIAWSTDQSPRSSWQSHSSLDCPEIYDPNDEPEETMKTPTVTFADSTTRPFNPPATVSVSEFTSSCPPSFPGFKLFDSGMTRSKSYSGLSEKDRPYRQDRTSLFKQSVDEENYKKYFHKFIDLVIVLETTAALHHSRPGSMSLP
jgi:hypothetical protein